MPTKDWKKYNINQVTFRLPEGMTKEQLDEEVASRNLSDRSDLIIKALQQFLSGETPTTSSESNEVLQQAFRELYRIFESFANSPDLDTALELFNNANLSIVDQAKELIK